MSPEQIAGKKVDGRSDLYSLGVMLFQMLTGVLPFRGDSMAELMYKIANEEAPDVRVIRHDLPERLAQVVALALSKRPETRYQDGDQFAADLRALVGAMDGTAAPAPIVPRAEPAAAADKTVAFSAAGASDADKTVVMAPPATGGDFEKTVVANAPAPGQAPGYDAGPQQTGAETDPFAKTAVMRRPPPGDAAGANPGKNDLEA
jgi:serine/threonine-protein kinase